VVTLEPLATIVGRLVDGAGKPVANVNIRTNISPIVDFGLHLPLVTSDRDGRFRVEGVPVGRDYVLIADRNISGSFTQIASAKAPVRPGETTDVGALYFK
ncbi:carboxypeptidase-like regulatory domain-containing protein, partial [Singulisphaera rosea]